MTLTPILRPIPRAFAATFLLTVLFLLSQSPVQAATLTVTNTNDSGAGSLRTQIAAAGAGDTINFAVTGTITLTTGEIIITQPLTISGPGANVLAISGNNNSRVFSINSTNVAVTITSLTITQGNGVGILVPGSGGGLRSLGPLTLINCIFVGNSATSGGGGVSLRNADGMFINCTFSDNTAGNQSGGIGYQGDGGHTLTLVNCTITGNRANGNGGGGGILNLASTDGGSSTLQVNNCTIANNTSANANGGGITTVSQINATSVATTILRSTIIANNTLPNLTTITTAPALPSVVISQGFNLASDDGTGFLNQPTDILKTNPLLGALANNGGPTPTLALLAGSPAIDKGNSFGLTTDQRGFARTIDLPSVANAAGGDGTDIGAFELNTNDSPVRVSDTKAGSVLVFPFYTSTIGGASDTRITISNLATATQQLEQVVDPGATLTYVHLFLIDGATCQQADLYLCLTPNASFSFKASEYDPGNTGYVLAVAVNAQGVPVRNNVLIGNAFVNTPDFADNYGAEAFWANSATVATVSGNTATLFFDNNGYDAVPNQFAVEIQSPVDVVGQQIVTAGLSGSLVTSQMSGAAQVGTGLAFNEKEVFGSFTNWLTGTCQARATISTTSPRVPNGIGNLIKTGQAGMLKFNVGAAVGLILTPRTATWKGIRTLHKTQTVATTITIPILVPVC